MSFLVFQWVIKCSMRNPDLALTLALTALIAAAEYQIDNTANEEHLNGTNPERNADNPQRLFRPPSDNANTARQEHANSTANLP